MKVGEREREIGCGVLNTQTNKLRYSTIQLDLVVVLLIYFILSYLCSGPVSGVKPPSGLGLLEIGVFFNSNAF
jgi:hypothetical protein